jgi:RNA polymerase sigma-70 factor (ECF subfamily)
MSATHTNFEERVRRLLTEGAPNAAATAVLDTLGPGLMRYLSSMLPGDDAGDAFSELQLCIWRGLPGFRWECPLRAWVYRLARHAAAHVASDGFRRRRLPLPTNVDFGLPHVEPEPAEGGDRSEQLALLRRELAPDERRLLALRIGRALPWNEVAAILASAGEGVTSAGLRKRFERLKLKLAWLARERGLVG